MFFFNHPHSPNRSVSLNSEVLHTSRTLPHSSLVSLQPQKNVHHSPHCLFLSITLQITSQHLPTTKILNVPSDKPHSPTPTSSTKSPFSYSHYFLGSTSTPLLRISRTRLPPHRGKSPFPHIPRDSGPHRPLLRPPPALGHPFRPSPAPLRSFPFCPPPSALHHSLPPKFPGLSPPGTPLGSPPPSTALPAPLPFPAAPPPPAAPRPSARHSSPRAARAPPGPSSLASRSLVPSPPSPARPLLPAASRAPRPRPDLQWRPPSAAPRGQRATTEPPAAVAAAASTACALPALRREHFRGRARERARTWGWGGETIPESG